MKKFIVLLALLSGCYSVPANMAVNIDRHDKNVQELHPILEGKLRSTITTLTDLASVTSDTTRKAVILKNRSKLKRLLMLSTADKKLSEKLNAWGKKNSDPEEFKRIKAERAAAAGGS
jgi:hypothetical protein